MKSVHCNEKCAMHNEKCAKLDENQTPNNEKCVQNIGKIKHYKNWHGSCLPHI